MRVCGLSILMKNTVSHFWTKTLLILLVLTSSGCSEINRVCQSGWLGSSFSLLFIFIETFVVAGVLSFIISMFFFMLLQRRKLQKWNLSMSQTAPKISASWSFPAILIGLLVVFVGLFFVADCSDSHKLVHILGVILGIIIGFGGGLLIYRKYVIRKKSYKIEPHKD